MDFDRSEWARLRANTPLTLSETDLAELQGLNDRISLAEVEAIYLPLSRFLNLHVAATQNLHTATDTFLGTLPNPLPYVIGVAGSVAVAGGTAVGDVSIAASAGSARSTRGRVNRVIACLSVPRPRPTASRTGRGRRPPARS